MKAKTQIKFLLGTVLAIACIGPLLMAQQPQPKATDVTGKWHFVFQTEGGDREFDATFQQDGEKVSGKWGDNNADVKGTFSGGKLSLEFPVNSEEAGPGTLKISGDLAEDVLTGTWSFSQYDGTFKATRSKATAS